MGSSVNYTLTKLGRSVSNGLFVDVDGLYSVLLIPPSLGDCAILGANYRSGGVYSSLEFVSKPYLSSLS